MKSESKKALMIAVIKFSIRLRDSSDQVTQLPNQHAKRTPPSQWKKEK